MALFPALFWTAVAAGIGAAVGSMPTPAALMTFGAAVATFCGVVGSDAVLQKLDAREFAVSDEVS